MNNSIPYILFICFIFPGCSKSVFLDKKSSSQLMVPTSIKHFQALLDNDEQMNNIVPFLIETGSDDFFCTDDYLNAMGTDYKNVYSWDDDMWLSNSGLLLNWSIPYGAIYNANIALEGISNIIPSDINKSAWNNVKGAAFFFRAFGLYHLAQVFSPAFESGNLEQQVGIPIRKTSDLTEEIHRSTLRETYEQILSDLLTAEMLLPDTVKIKNKPSKAAVYSLLSRVYLSMGNYREASNYASKCLNLKGDLLDYNLLDSTSYTPIDQSNSEVILIGGMISFGLIPNFAYPGAAVDSVLVSTYHPDDLRKKIFYEDNGDGTSFFKGNYNGSGYLFAGLAVDEIYLIKAESEARLGNLDGALFNVNYLISKRWRKEVFVPFETDDLNVALEYILNERRKELVFRGIRWTDIRRINVSGGQLSIERSVGGENYLLKPRDKKFTYLIPPEVISFNKDMPQNTR